MAIVIFEHSDLSRSGRLGRILRNHGHRLDVRRLHRGDSVPVDLKDVDGIVSCGAPGSANDDSIPWFADEMEYLQAAGRADLPMVGICFGSQILARALGGTVERHDAIELGWHAVQLTRPGKTDTVHAGVSWETMQFHYHRDQIAQLPDGATRLASSETCENQAWSLGQRIYGFQYHGECDAATIEAWADDDPSVLEEAGLSREELTEQTNRYAADMARVNERIFEHIALLVMPVDRRAAGLVKGLHH